MVAPSPRVRRSLLSYLDEIAGHLRQLAKSQHRRGYGPGDLLTRTQAYRWLGFGDVRGREVLRGIAPRVYDGEERWLVQDLADAGAPKKASPETDWQVDLSKL